MRLFTLALVASLACAGFAQDVSGKWTGRYIVDLARVPQAERERVAAQAKSTKLTMTLRKDKTFTVEFVGNGQSNTTTGVYRVEKGKLITTDTKRNGKPIPNASRRTATFTISGGGKELRMKPQNTTMPAELVLTMAG